MELELAQFNGNNPATVVKYVRFRIERILAKSRHTVLIGIEGSRLTKDQLSQMQEGMPEERVHFPNPHPYLVNGPRIRRQNSRRSRGR
jgi:hypothetical protein